jgi:hypothetical protein
MSVIAAAVVTSAVGGAYAANKAFKAQDRATDAASAAASEQNALSKEQFDWNKEIYERDIAPMQKIQQETQLRVVDDALARADKQDRLADEQKSYYDSTFRPIEQQVARDAMDYDSAGNMERRSGIAAANVNQQFSNAIGQRARMAGRYGLGSSTFANQAGADSRAQALGAAGAKTGAAFDTLDKGIQLRAGAANFGRNMPNAALSGYSGASGSSTAAGNASSSALSGVTGAAGFMNNAYGNRINGIGSSTGLFANAMNNSANMWGNAAAGFGNLAGGLYQKAGGFGGMQAAFSNTGLGSSGFGTGMAYGNQDLGAYV